MCLYRVKVKKHTRISTSIRRTSSAGYSEGVYPNSKIKTYTGKMIRTLGEKCFKVLGIVKNAYHRIVSI